MSNTTDSKLGTKFNRGQSIIEKATELEHITDINIYYGLYLFALIVLICTYLGPFFYFKIFKKKNFSAQNNLGVKHAI